jgi:hypothetical protein
MRRYSFLSQGRAFATCGGDVLGKDVSQPVVAERLASCAGKDGIRGARVEFTDPSPQGNDRVFAQRGTPLSTTLAQATHMGATAESHVLTTQTD